MSFLLKSYRTYILKKTQEKRREEWKKEREKRKYI
jgi:hypothetical protein